MKIGEFAARLKTTQDTLRHYEDLNLITPEWNGGRKEYGKKDVMNFEAIVDMKDMGLTLKDIQLIFQLKQTLGCSSPELIQQVSVQLSQHLESIIKEEQQLHTRRVNLEEIIKELQQLEVQ